MAAVSPLPSWTSVQGEFTQGNFAFESRVAIMHLNPPAGLELEAVAGPLPHVTFHLQVTGQEPIALADFDAAAFIQNVRENHSKEILAALAPHLLQL